MMASSLWYPRMNAGLVKNSLFSFLQPSVSRPKSAIESYRAYSLQDGSKNCVRFRKSFEHLREFHKVFQKITTLN